LRGKVEMADTKIHPVRYTYVLFSEKDNQFYVGYTEDLKRRLEEHHNGKISSTRNRRALKLVYYEVGLNQQDATEREKCLKTAWGKRYIKNRIKNYLLEIKNDR
jgi:putative endonuclease